MTPEERHTDEAIYAIIARIGRSVITDNMVKQTARYLTRSSDIPYTASSAGARYPDRYIDTGL